MFQRLYDLKKFENREKNYFVYLLLLLDTLDLCRNYKKVKLKDSFNTKDKDQLCLIGLKMKKLYFFAKIE